MLNSSNVHATNFVAFIILSVKMVQLELAD